MPTGGNSDPPDSNSVMAAPRVKPEGRLRAAIHDFCGCSLGKSWVPACAGMTGLRGQESESFGQLV